MASRTLSAIYKDGALELAETLELQDGDQVTVTIHDGDTDRETPRRAHPVRNAFGAWKDLVDPVEFKRYLRESREIASRPTPRL